LFNFKCATATSVLVAGTIRVGFVRLSHGGKRNHRVGLAVSNSRWRHLYLVSGTKAHCDP